jgi:predicted dehydrogenase
MKQSRRKFVQTLAGGSLVASTIAKNAVKISKSEMLKDNRSYQLEEGVRIAAIGMGIMGNSNVRTALSIPGTQLIATCDLYDGRLERSKELYGDNIATYRDYKQLLERDDIDAVIVATSDHWHDAIAKDVLASDKHLYLEKPMVHQIAEGRSVIEAEKSSGKIVQIGSQRVSSLVSKKAKEIYESGAIGQLVLAEASFNRQSAMGAWQYSIPRDASPETVDWDRFLGDAPKVPFDEKHFFRWRNYQAYGTGVAGDLFVHLFSGMHYLLSSNGPSKIYATGGLRYWEDGRDVPDVMLALFDYPKTETHPAFNMVLKVNFIDGGGGGGDFKLVGTEGVLEMRGNDLILSKSKMSDAPGYGNWDSLETFSSTQQEEFLKWYNETYPNPSKRVRVDKEVVFKTPKGFDAHKEHYMNFFNAIHGKEKAIEDSSFGLRAAAPSLAANMSYFEKRPIFWDPKKMELLDT